MGFSEGRNINGRRKMYTISNHNPNTLLGMVKKIAGYVVIIE